MRLLCKILFFTDETKEKLDLINFYLKNENMFLFCRQHSEAVFFPIYNNRIESLDKKNQEIVFVNNVFFDVRRVYSKNCRVRGHVSLLTNHFLPARISFLKDEFNKAAFQGSSKGNVPFFWPRGCIENSEEGFRYKNVYIKDVTEYAITIETFDFKTKHMVFENTPEFEMNFEEFIQELK